MSSGTRHRALSAALAAFVGLAVVSGLAGCTSAEISQIDRRPIPPIDHEVPEHLETATFALG
jgi:hypothetical protein